MNIILFNALNFLKYRLKLNQKKIKRKDLKTFLFIALSIYEETRKSNYEILLCIRT